MADQSAQKPDVAKLVARLRAQAKATGNSVVGGTMGEDMLAAAVVIEQQLLCSRLDAAGLVTALPANTAMALAQMAKRFLYADAERFSSRHDGGAERDAMLGGIRRLQSQADAGFPPR